MDTVNRVIKNTGFLYGKMGITMFISLLNTRLILNSLGVSDFGVFNVVGGAIAMLGFLNGAMTSATQRFMSFAEGEGNLQKLKHIFNVSIILHSLIAIVVGIVLLIAGHFFFNGLLNISSDRIHAAHVIYYFMIISTMITVMTVPYEAVLNAHENMLYFSIVGIIESLLKLIVAIVVVYVMADKLIIYGALMAGVSLIVMFIMRIYTHKHYIECVFAPGIYWDKTIMKKMTGFAGWNFLSASTSVFSQYGLSIVLNNFFGTILNAAQGIANQINGQLMAFSNTMMKALNPVIAKSEGKGDRTLMLDASLIGSKFSYMLVVFFSIPFIIETPYILHIWLKNVPDWAILFARLQLLRSMIEQLTLIFNRTIDAEGRIKNYSIIKSIINILPIVLTIILFYMGFAPYYLYITWIFCWGIMGGIVTLYFSNKQCGLSYLKYFKVVVKPDLLLSSIMLLSGLLPVVFMEQSFVRLCIVIAITSAAFILSNWLLILSDMEKKFISGLFLKIKQKINNK